MKFSQDPSSLRYCPKYIEWWDFLVAKGLDSLIAVPASVWLCDETSGSLVDSGIGGRNVTVNGSPTYGATATGWTRTGIKPPDGSATAYGTCTIPDVNTTSGMLLQYFSLNTAATAARGLNRIGSVTAEHATLQSGNKLRGTSNANTANGTRQQAGTLVMITKLDRSRSELAVYTQDEKIAPTWSNPASSTTLTLFGDASAASDATIVYAAYWPASTAELSDSIVQKLLDALESDMTTRAKMSAGSAAYKTVVAIEGYNGLLSDAPSATVLAALHGHDYTTVLGGLFINIQNQQAVEKDSPFTSSGRCTIRALDETGLDTLGRAIHKRLSGAESPITATVDRNDTTVNVESTMNFPSSGTAYIGTECFTYTGTTATAFTGCTRGMYSPFGTATSGSGGLRFGGNHRFGNDSNNVKMQPLVTQLPRSWVGKRVGVWLHTWDEINQTINHKREAQLVYAGRIVQIGDDANNSTTVIEIEHITKDLQNATLGRDQWKSTLADGLELKTGRIFKFTEGISGSAESTANDLVVVSGTPASTNEIKAGYYYGNELCAAISAWLAGEKTAARIAGFYNWQSPVSSNVGPRTKCYWRREGTANAYCGWTITMPGEVHGFLGLSDDEPGTLGQSATWSPKKAEKANVDHIRQGALAPFHTLIFKPGGPGRLAQEFSEAGGYEAENESGEFIDQFSLLPFAVKGSCDSTKPWGVFLFDEKSIIIGSLTDGILSNCWLAPFQLTGENDAAAMRYMGRRVDEPERGPITLRQLLVLEERWKVLVKTLLYSTGISGYNHGTFDTLSYQLGVGMPGELLGDEFERSLDNMPGADVPIVVVLDEPTRFIDLISADLLLRRSFVRFKDQHFEAVQWRTPLAANAIAALTEETKASADPNPQFRCSSVLSNEFARPTVKFDYSRDFAIGRGDNYQKSFAVVDQTQCDDLGGSVKLATVKLRNTFEGTSAVGAGLDSLLAEFAAVMPTFRPSQAIERSLDQRYYLELAPGDIVTVTDSFARDPLSGERGISERAAMVVSHSYSMGGFTPTGKDAQSGRIELNFLDVQRGEQYAPGAMVDYSAGSGGFSAGYSSGTSTLRCFEHAYSNNSTLVVIDRGRRRTGKSVAGADPFVAKRYPEEADDATYFDPGDKILIIEIDPADPASPTYWEREVLSQSGQDIVLTTGLSAPAWDAAKKYRIVPQKWSQVILSQQDWSYQADDADHMIEDDEVPFHFSASEELTTFSAKDGTEKGEYIPNMSYGDGRPMDVAHERGVINTINAYFDSKSAHQGSFLWNRTARANGITWNTLYCGPIFLGMDMLSSRVTRTLTVAPFWRSATGAASTLRVSLSRIKPQAGATVDVLAYGADAFRDPKLTDAFSQTSTWSTSSTTWGTGADATLSVGVKDMVNGIAWLVVEGGGEAECRGLAKMIEGIRVVG